MTSLQYFMNDKPLEAARFLVNSSDNLLIEGNPDLEQFITGEHLAFYLVLSCVAHMSRLEIK